nr:MAG: hypothetical protein CM15mV30_1020 [uncultured marine virus]
MQNQSTKRALCKQQGVSCCSYRISKSVDKAEKQKKEKPPVTKYIGECFLKIAQHLSYRPNFINYTYKHDMISDA